MTGGKLMSTVLENFLPSIQPAD